MSKLYWAIKQSIEPSWWTDFICWCYELRVYSWWCNLVCFYHNLKWMLPAAWRFRSWDYNYNLELFGTSLKVTGNTIRKYGHCTTSKKIGTRCYSAGHNLIQAYKWDEIDDKSFMYLLHNNPFTLKDCTLTHKYKYSEEYYTKLHATITKRIDTIKKKNKKEAWDYLHKHIETFWD